MRRPNGSPRRRLSRNVSKSISSALAWEITPATERGGSRLVSRPSSASISSINRRRVELVVDGERGLVAEDTGVGAQHAQARRVERRHPHPLGPLAHQVDHPAAHLVGRLVGEGDGQDLPRRRLVGREQVGDPAGEHAGLPDPAPATTRSGPPRWATAARWGGLSPSSSSSGVGGRRRSSATRSGPSPRRRRLVGGRWGGTGGCSWAPRGSGAGSSGSPGGPEASGPRSTCSNANSRVRRGPAAPSLPLDGAGRLRRHVEGHPVHPFDLRDDARRRDRAWIRRWCGHFCGTCWPGFAGA